MARKPILSEEQLQEIVNNSPHKMCNKWNLVSKYCISEKTAERMMKKLGLIQTSDSNIEMILRYLNGERNPILCEEYGISQSNLNSLLRFRNIEARKNMYFADYNYFDEIDSEDKSYFLGFIYADGNFSRNSLKIFISEQDVDVLEKFKYCLKSNHDIKRKKGSGYTSSDKLSSMVELMVSHRTFPKILAKHGIVENKTHHIKSIPNTIPKELIRHFIRGYMDGDGSFSKYVCSDGYTRYSVDVIGTELFLKDWIRYFDSIDCDFSFCEKFSIRWKERENNTRGLRMSGKENVINFLNWLYDDATVVMDRKYKKYKQIVE